MNNHYYFVRKVVMPKWMVMELWQGGRLGGESFYELQQFVALPDNVTLEYQILVDFVSDL